MGFQNIWDFRMAWAKPMRRQIDGGQATHVASEAHSVQATPLLTWPAITMNHIKRFLERTRYRSGYHGLVNGIEGERQRVGGSPRTVLREEIIVFEVM